MTFKIDFEGISGYFEFDISFALAGTLTVSFILGGLPIDIDVSEMFYFACDSIWLKKTCKVVRFLPCAFPELITLPMPSKTSVITKENS